MKQTVLGLCALAVLTGCAQTPPPMSPGAPSSAVSSARPSGASATPSASATPRTSTSPSPTPSGPSPAVAPKSLSTATLPATLGAYRAASPTGTAGEQTATYTGAATTDVVIVAVLPRGDLASATNGLKDVTVKTPAVCGTVPTASTGGAVCALPLDRGFVLVTGSGAQTLDQIAGVAAQVWAALP